MVLHVSVAAAVVLLSYWRTSAHVLGQQHPGGGSSWSINVVQQMPLPAHSGAINPGRQRHALGGSGAQAGHGEADEGQRTGAGCHPAEEPQRAEEAVAKASSLNKYRAKQIDRPNQLYSTEGQKLVSPMYGQPGSGGVGVGRGSPFGDRFGYYVDLLRQKVAQKWRTSDVDPRIRTRPPAIVTFTIRRDGSISGVRMAQTSGNLALDVSAQRAIADAAPFPPLPAGFDRSDVSIEFWFELKR